MIWFPSSCSGATAISCWKPLQLFGGVVLLTPELLALRHFPCEWANMMFLPLFTPYHSLLIGFSAESAEVGKRRKGESHSGPIWSCSLSPTFSDSPHFPKVVPDYRAGLSTVNHVFLLGTSPALTDVQWFPFLVVSVRRCGMSETPWCDRPPALSEKIETWPKLVAGVGCRPVSLHYNVRPRVTSVEEWPCNCS